MDPGGASLWTPRPSPHLDLAYGLLILLVPRLEERLSLVDQVAQIFLLLGRQNTGDSLAGRWRLHGENGVRDRGKELSPAPGLWGARPGPTSP